MKSQFTDATSTKTQADCPSCQFSTRDVERLTGMNRGSLRYFEKRGVLNPVRTGDADYRTYSILDINHLIGLSLLMNAGIPASEAWADEDVPGTWQDVEITLGSCRQHNKALMAWRLAIDESLERLLVLFAPDSVLVPRIIKAERTLMWFNVDEQAKSARALDGATGYAKLQPVCSVSCLYDEEWFGAERNEGGRWGVSVRERYVEAAKFEQELDVNSATVLEAQTYASIPFTLPADATRRDELNPSASARERLAAYIDENGLDTCGPALLSDYLPVGMTLYATLNVPVR